MEHVDGGSSGVELRVELDFGVVPSLRLLDGDMAKIGLDVVEELDEELFLGSRLLHRAIGVVHRGVPLVEKEADADLRRSELLQRLSDRDEVLQRLGHLQSVDIQMSRVQKVVHRLSISHFSRSLAHLHSMNASLCAISFVWCGNRRSTPPECTSMRPSLIVLKMLNDIAEHSMCQPGRPSPHGELHIGSPGLLAFHSAKSLGWRFSEAKSCSSSVFTLPTISGTTWNRGDRLGT